eukprot:5921463-Amphidinium_carterae.1
MRMESMEAHLSCTAQSVRVGVARVSARAWSMRCCAVVAHFVSLLFVGSFAALPGNCTQNQVHATIPSCMHCA